MKTFGSFIIEAKVSAGRVEKTLNIFIRLLEKKIGTVFHRYGGPRGNIITKSGVGYLFIGRNKMAVSFNYGKGSFNSITLWKNFKVGKKADYTIDLGGLGLLQAGKKLLDIITNPKPGKFGVFANPELKESFLTEAKRIKPEDFFNLVSNSIKPDQIISSLLWSDISDIAAANGKLIPSVVRDCKVSGKGAKSRYDLTKLVSDKFSPAEERKTEKDYYIKITAQDKETKSFVSVKGDKVAQDMLNTIRHAIDTPDVKKELKDPNTLFGIMRNLVQLVARKSRNSLIIYGGPGIGKTYTVLQTLKDEGLVKNQDWFMIKGKITTVALYQNLFMHRKGSVLVFDDTDSVWGDKEAANILKAALDSYETRTISWFSSRTVNVSKMTEDEKEEFNDAVDLKLDSGDNVKLPSEFEFNGRIIFISNLKKENFDSAVLTRSAKIDMTLTDEQIFIRMKGILPHLGNPNVPIDIKEEILDFLRVRNKAGLLSGPSMRTYVAAEDLYNSGLENWKDLLDYV